MPRKGNNDGKDMRESSLEQKAPSSSEGGLLQKGGGHQYRERRKIILLVGEDSVYLEFGRTSPPSREKKLWRGD